MSNSKLRIGIDLAALNGEKASANIMLPNNTTISIEGDPEIVTQVINKLDGMQIYWQPIKSIDNV